MTGRRLALGLWLAGLALAVALIAHTRFVADLSAFLPSAPTPEQRFLVDQLRDGAVSRVMLIGIDGGDAASRARGRLARSRNRSNRAPLFPARPTAPEAISSASATCCSPTDTC